MKRKNAAKWIALTMVSVLLAGCVGGGGSTPSNHASSAQSTTEKTQEARVDEADTGDTDAEASATWEFFPAPGEEMHGFRLEEVRAFPLIGAEIGLFEHGATGAKLMYFHNDDTNRAFDLTFLTRASDNTGIPHVFEHATLDGSEKYPSKELFFNLGYQTYQTYMNAMTAENMTTYPLASLSEAQLLKLADFYTDSCLHPGIMENESIFREEAWRYRLDGADEPLTIEGTVYSEMCGAMDKSTWAYYNAIRAALPGSFMGFVSGGDPACIPDMTFEALCDFHDRYYHPSNCIAYLYGDIEDYGAFLELLDEAFSGYEKKGFLFEDNDYVPLTEPVTAEVAFAAEEKTATDNASVVYYTIVCGDLEEEERIAMTYLLSLLSESASDLNQQLQKELPTGLLSVTFEMTGTETVAEFSMENINREDAGKFRDLVDRAIADVAANGFPADLVDGVMARTQLENKIIREGSDIGVNLIFGFAYEYAKTGNPWYQLDLYEADSEMETWNADGTFAKLAESYLKDSKTIALVTTYPEPGLKEKQDAGLAQKLAKIREEMSEEEAAALVARTHEEDEADGASSEASSAEGASDASTEDENDAQTDNYVAQLKAVTVEELPEEVRTYEMTDETDDNGVRHLNAEAAVDGVGLTQVLLDASGVEEDALHDLALFVALTGYLDTNKHTRGELETLSTRYLYNPSVTAGADMDANGDTKLYLSLSWIAGEEDLETGYDLMHEMLYDLKLDDVQKLSESVAAIRSDLKTAVNLAPYSIQLMRGMARFSEEAAYRNHLGGLEYYSYLEETEAALADEKTAKETVERLQAVQEQMHNAYGAVALFAGDASSIRTNETCVNTFLERLGFEEIRPASHDLLLPEKTEGLIVESSVQYNGIFAGFETMGLDGMSGSLDVTANVVLDLFLYPMLRDRYGAYGVIHRFAEDMGGFMISYRDPNVTETFDVYEQLPKLLRDLEIDRETLDGYIMSGYVTYAMPQGELTGAISALSDLFAGVEPGETALRMMREMKETTPEAVTAFADVYAKMLEDGARSTAGGAAVITEHEAMYDAVYNPFATQPAELADGFADVPEDHPLYAYVLKAYENGLMKPLTEDTFGVGEDATAGDFAYAFASLLGGASDGGEALSMLQQYGLFPATLQAQDPLKRDTLIGIMESMAATGGGSMDAINWDDFIAGDVVTRGELARILTEENI